jgi:hypothetical protein
MIRRSPQPRFRMLRVSATYRIAGLASHRGQYLGTVFRSPVATAFATTPRSMLPTCAFDSARKNFADPFDIRLLRSVRFRGRSGAISSPITRFPRRIPTLLRSRRSPLPFWPSRLSETTIRIKAFNRSARQKPASKNALNPSAPRRVSLSITLRIDAFRLASFLSANRSVNPGTESMMTQETSWVNRKITHFRVFQQLFGALEFNEL